MNKDDKLNSEQMVENGDLACGGGAFHGWQKNGEGLF